MTALSDDIASVVSALTASAAEQRRWQAEYETKAAAEELLALVAATQSVYAQHRATQSMWARNAAMAHGTANAYEVSADMISKYIGVSDE